MSQWISTAAAWSHVAHYESCEAQRKIFAKLIEGELLALAELFTLDNVEHRNTEMPKEFWDVQWTRLDLASGTATRAVSDFFASINEKGERVVRQYGSDTATGIRLDRAKLLTFWPPIPQSIYNREESQ
jgi:hypothetical protein